MNDLSNSLPPAGDDALEARIVAWVLGEASPFEAAELEKLCAENPHLRAFERRIRDLNELLVADAKPGLHASWQLPEEKRGKVMDLLGSAEQTVVHLVPEPSRKVVRYFSRRALLAAAACLAISLVAYSMFGSIGGRSRYAAESQVKSVDFMASAPTSYEMRTPDSEAAEHRLKVLQDAITKQEDLVEDKRKLLSSIIRSGKVVSSSERGAGGFAAGDDATDAARNYAKLEQEKVQLESQIETLLKYDGNQLANYAGTLNLPGDNALPQVAARYQEAKREVEAAKASGLGEGHPDLAAREKQLAGMERDMGEAAANLRESLKAKRELANDQLARVEARMTVKKDDAVKSGLETQDYLAAKQDFESQQRHLEQLKLKLVADQMDAKVAGEELASNERKSNRGIADEAPNNFGDAGRPLAASRPERPQVSRGPSGPPAPTAAPAAPATPPPVPAPAPALATADDHIMAGDLLALQDGDHDIASRRSGGMGGGGGRLGLQDSNSPMGGGRRPADPADPAKPGQDIAGAKELAEADLPVDTARAKFKGDAVPASGPAAADPAAATALSAQFEVKDREVAAKKSEAPAIHTAATDRFGASAPEAKPQTAMPAEPQGLAREPVLEAGGTADGLSHFSRQQAQVEQKGEKTGHNWYALDEATKTASPELLGEQLANTTRGGLKVDLSKNLEMRDLSAADLTGLGAITPGGAGAPTVTGVWNGWGMQAAPGAAGSGPDFRAWLASGRGESPQTMDGSSALMGRAFNVNGTNFDGFVNYGTPLFGNGAVAANPMVRPPGGMPTELDVVETSPNVNAYFSQLGAERSNAPGNSLSFSVDALPTLQAQLQGAGQDFGNPEMRYRFSNADLAWSDADNSGAAIPSLEGMLQGPESATRLGERSSVEIMREFIYPDEYEVLELPSVAGEPVLDPAIGATLGDANKAQVDALADALREPKERAKPAGAVLDGGAKQPMPLREADQLLLEGRDAYAKSDYEGAVAKYKNALGKVNDLPDAGVRIKLLRDHIADGEVALAEQDLEAGRSEAAGKRLQEAFAFAPDHAEAKLLKKRLDDTLAIGDEIAAASEAFSTFSLHVSDASFKMAKAALDRGEQPAAEGIRPEEFYNAFDYGDPAPAQGEPVVCVTEQCAHPAVPQRNLLRIGVRTAAAGRGASTPLNLTLLLDSSGSMERPDRQAAMTRAVAQLSGLLKEGDTITVAGFARQPRLLADRLPGARANELNQIVAQTPSEGGTNIEEGLKLAEELAKRQFNPAAQNRIVLFTDGAANLGDARPEALRGRVEQLRQQGIAFDAAGFGADGLNDRLLEQLTRNGNGRYYIVDRAEEAGESFAKQLAGAFRPAAENVKVQVRFNPARVARYKLLGFEEHRLKKEDFRNDAVDAAEMAAEEAGNALYQFEPLPGGEGQVGEVSVRFRDAASGQMVERTWTIPYETQAPAFDRATPSIQLAGLAAFAAEKLRQAPLSDALDFKELGKSFPAVKTKYPDSQPVRDLGGMIEKLK